MIKNPLPVLPESSLITYLGQVLHMNVGTCSSFDDVLEKMEEQNIHIPGLSLEAGTLFMPDRFHLYAALYNMKEGSALFELMDAFMSERYSGVYVLTQDATCSGKNGLYLLSVSNDQTMMEAHTNNIQYMADVWGKMGNPVAHMITGGCRQENGDVMSIVAVQLASILPKRE